MHQGARFRLDRVMAYFLGQMRFRDLLVRIIWDIGLRPQFTGEFWCGRPEAIYPVPLRVRSRCIDASILRSTVNATPRTIGCIDCWSFSPYI